MRYRCTNIFVWQCTVLQRRGCNTLGMFNTRVHRQKQNILTFFFLQTLLWCCIRKEYEEQVPRCSFFELINRFEIEFYTCTFFNFSNSITYYSTVTNSNCSLSFRTRVERCVIRWVIHIYLFVFFYRSKCFPFRSFHF